MNIFKRRESAEQVVVMGLIKNLARRWADPKLVEEVDRLRHKLIKTEAANERLTQERDRARHELAEQTAENVSLVDAKRHLEASLSGVHEQLRQEKAARARAEREAAEAAVTVDGLGLAMAELERKDFLDEDRRHVRRMDGAGDHL